MTVHARFTLACTRCGRQHEDDGESIAEARELGRNCGWIYKKVQNGSYWDFCPRCQKKELE